MLFLRTEKPEKWKEIRLSESIQSVKKWAGNAAISHAGIEEENDEFYGEITINLPSHYPSFQCPADIELRIYQHSRIEYTLFLAVDEEHSLTIKGKTDGKTTWETLLCIEKKLIEINKSVSVVLGGLIANIGRDVYPD